MDFATGKVLFCTFGGGGEGFTILAILHKNCSQILAIQSIFSSREITNLKPNKSVKFGQVWRS